MRSANSRLWEILDAERAAASALSRLPDDPTGPDVRACLKGLHETTTWLCEGLAKRIPRAAKRRSGSAGPMADPTEQVMRAPTNADRLRLLNRHERSVLARIDSLLLQPLEGDLREFLQEAHIILGRCVARCDEAIAGLDREREVRCEPHRSTPGASW